MPKDAKVEFKAIGVDEQMCYVKVDLAKACRVGANYALGFYQIDYQTLANSLAASKGETTQGKLMPVCKIVMDVQGFDQLFKEIVELKSRIDQQKSEEGKLP